MRSTWIAVPALLFALPDGASAWSHPQHEIICELAWDQLSFAAKRFVQHVRTEAHLAGLEPNRTFARECTWADEVRDTEFRGTYEYHFLNVEEDFDALDRERDCAALDCAPVAILRYAEYLEREPGSGERTRQRRGWALRFLGHFVADLHQPLHAAHASDLGGNFIRVRWRDEDDLRTLHAVWDGTLPKAAGIADLEDAERLLGELAAVDTEAWKDAEVWAWASEAYELAKRFAYRWPSGKRVRTGQRLRDDYIDAALPVVKGQMLKASVRLAWVLEKLAAGANPFAGVGLEEPAGATNL